MSRKYAIEFDGQFANCDNLKINDMTVEQMRADIIDEFVTYLENFMWWSDEADEQVIGEFALEEYAEMMKEQK